MKHSEEFKRGAKSALKELLKKFPIETKFPCDCSADVVYYIDKILKKYE